MVPKMSRFNPHGPPTSSSLYRVDWLFNYKSQLYQCRLDYEWQGGTLAHDNQGAADIIAGHSRSDWLAALPNDCTWLGIRLVDLMSPTDPIALSSVTGGVANGTVASPSLPGELAVLFTKRTTLRGQHGMGHMFVPCIPTSFVTSGETNGTATAPYNNLSNTLETPPVAMLAGFSLLPVVTEKNDGTPEVPSYRRSIITSITWSTNPTDRSTRKVGRGK